MKNAEITDTLFREAVEAIDSGNLTALEGLLAAHPKLVRDRLNYLNGGYFKDPYLLWYVADNPIRIDRLPVNIAEVTSLLIQAVKSEAADSSQHQLDYALGLVATGRVPKECGVQIKMMDLLIDAGARAAGGLGAFAHGNIEAAEHLIGRGGQLTFAAAVCLEHMEDVNRLAPLADKDERLTAFTAAAFYGKSPMISLLLGMGVDPNGYPKSDSGFHSHATPLHQAVSSRSLDAVKLLVEAGAKLDAADQIYDGTPLEWAEHMQAEESFDEATKKKYALIAEYLASKQS
jgi:Ankyrin repeats (3 copies)